MLSLLGVLESRFFCARAKLIVFFLLLALLLEKEVFFESARDPQRVKLSAEGSCLSAEGWNWDFGGVFLSLIHI